MRVAVLGAAGAMAQVVLRDLLEFQGGIRITAVDRRPVPWIDPRVAAAEADLEDEAATAALLAGHDAVLNCVTYYLNVPVMRAALAARVPYADLGGLYHGSLKQFELDREFRAAGLRGAPRHGLDAGDHERHGGGARPPARRGRGDSRPGRLPRPQRRRATGDALRARHRARRVRSRADGLRGRAAARAAAVQRPGDDRVPAAGRPDDGDVRRCTPKSRCSRARSRRCARRASRSPSSPASSRR